MSKIEIKTFGTPVDVHVDGERAMSDSLHHLLTV
jgi:hypothetical protein